MASCTLNISLHAYVFRLMLRITFIAFRVAKPISPRSHSTAEAKRSTHEVRELCFVEFRELEFFTSVHTPIFKPVSLLPDLVLYECEMVLHSRFQGHP